MFSFDMFNFEMYHVLSLKIAPLYIFILIGYFAGRMFNVDRNSIVTIVFYFVIPVVFFNYARRVELHAQHFLVPLITWGLAMLFSCSAYIICRRIFKEGNFANIIAFSAGTGNTGYFGLLVAMMLFEPNVVALYMLANIGVSIYDYTLGAYYFVSSKMSAKQAVIQVMKLPMLYSLAVGLLFNYFKLPVPVELNVVFDSMRGTYATLGMMLIGLSLSNINSYKINWTFSLILLVIKFVFTPLAMLAIVYFDQEVFHLFNRDVHNVLLLLSFVPPAANTVIFTTLYKCHPEETAMTILIGNIMALILIPLMISSFIVI
jgi:predicted permease